MEFDYTTVLNRLREQAFLTAGVTIELYDERDFDGKSQEEADLENGLISEEDLQDEEDREDGGYYRKEKEKDDDELERIKAEIRKLKDEQE